MALGMGLAPLGALGGICQGPSALCGHSPVLISKKKPPTHNFGCKKSPPKPVSVTLAHLHHPAVAFVMFEL